MPDILPVSTEPAPFNAYVCEIRTHGELGLLPHHLVKLQVKKLSRHAAQHPQRTFTVQRAGWKLRAPQVAKLFAKAPPNVKLAE